MPPNEKDSSIALAAMDRLRAEIGLLRDRLNDAERAVEERDHMMLLAETPQAAHAYRLARDAQARIRGRLSELEASLGALILDHEEPGRPAAV